MPAYQIERSVEISAPPAKVFDVVSDFNSWSAWSPWLIAEPEAIVRVTGTPRSVGSHYSWAGDVTGEGEMTLLRAESPRSLDIELRFLKPFKSTAGVAFELHPTPTGGTRLSWRMDGNLPWFLFWMIPMMKTFLGMDYHRGLLMAKDWIEAGAVASKVTPHGIESVGPLRMLGVAASAHVESVGETAHPAMMRCQQLFDQHGLPRTGEGMAVYHDMKVKTGMLDFTVGYTVSDAVALPADGSLREWRLPAVRAFRVEHTGAYHHLGNGWAVANMLTRHRKMKQSKAGAYEVYRHSPGKAAADLTVDIYLPLKK